MSKLLTLKNWLTIEEAAGYLSGALGEEVKDTDILQLAIQGKITVSTIMNGSELAFQCYRVPFLPRLKEHSQTKADLNPDDFTVTFVIRGNRFESFCHPTRIQGIYDLTLVGSEREIILNKYQRMTGHSVEKWKRGGTREFGSLLKRGEDFYALCSVLGDYYKNYDERSVYPEDIEEHHQLVIKAKEIERFIETLSQQQQPTPNESNSQLTDNPKSIDSLLKMVMAMAVDCYGYSPADKKSTATSDIVEAVQSIGHKIDADTVKKWLKEGGRYLTETAD